jgi:chromosome partitioning protein
MKLADFGIPHNIVAPTQSVRQIKVEHFKRFGRSYVDHRAGCDIATVQTKSRRIASSRNKYDLIIIDCSPSLGLITVNALVAADSVMVPVQCEFFALEGLGKLLNTIKIVQSRLNPNLAIEGILMTMYDARLRLCNQVVSEVRRHFDAMVFSTIIHRNTRLSEAPSVGKPVILYDATSKGSTNYLNLAKEVLQKNNLTKIAEKDRYIS